MSRRLSFRVRLSPAEPAAPRGPAFGIVLVVAGSWIVCVGAAWLVAGAIRLAARFAS